MGYPRPARFSTTQSNRRDKRRSREQGSGERLTRGARPRPKLRKTQRPKETSQRRPDPRRRPGSSTAASCSNSASTSDLNDQQRDPEQLRANRGHPKKNLQLV